MKKSRHGVRCRSRSVAFRVLAAVVAVLLPLQGMTGAMAAIEAPAHYHVRAPATVTSAPSGKSSAEAIAAPEQASPSPPLLIPRPGPRASRTQATVLEEASTDRARLVAPAVHSHRGGSHIHDASAELSKSKTDGVDELARAIAASHDTRAKFDPAPHNGPVTSDTRIGHHAHALADPGVVYVKGAPDQPESAAASAQAAAADAALTGWWMPLRGDIGPQSLPHAAWRFQSHPDQPALRPPAAADALTA